MLRNLSTTLLCTLAVAAFARVASAQDPALSADEIVNRALETDTAGFPTGEVVMSLIIQDASGETRERRMQVRSMTENGDGRALVRVVAPVEQAGQSYLFRENAGGQDDVFVYLPALDDAPRRISRSQKNGSFMGTHFTYADLESRDIRDATYTRLPDETIGTFPVYVVDAVPNDGVESEYASIRMWVRTTDFIPLRIRFFDDAGTAQQTMFTEETAVDGERVYVRRLTLRPATGGATTMIIDNVDFDAAIAPSEFTRENLTR
jgi:outer membrane lipoprotein-sorting protein